MRAISSHIYPGYLCIAAYTQRVITLATVKIHHPHCPIGSSLRSRVYQGVEFWGAREFGISENIGK